LEPNLAGDDPLPKLLIVCQSEIKTWLPGPIMCSDWAKLQRSCCQEKGLGHFNYYITGMIIGE